MWDPILKIVVAEGKKFFETDKRKFRTIKLVQSWFFQTRSAAAEAADDLNNIF